MRALLLFLARYEGFKNLALRFGIFRETALRFIAGETLDDAVAAVKNLNRQNMAGTLDLLGEETRSRDDALASCAEIEEMFDRIEQEGMDCNVSLKLTQLGLGLDEEFARENLLRIVRHASKKRNFVRVDMEDSRYTRSTIDTVIRVHDEAENVGAVIQAYLYRSRQDTLSLIMKGIRIRLVKGAYLESPDRAFRRKSDTDANFVKLMQMLLEAETHNAIATHDEAIIRAVIDFARNRRIDRDHFEFQMLYGIRRDLQYRLARDGYRVRIYIPYGRRWYPYFMRRLAERPANVGFILRNMFKG